VCLIVPLQKGVLVQVLHPPIRSPPQNAAPNSPRPVAPLFGFIPPIPFCLGLASGRHSGLTPMSRIISISSPNLAFPLFPNSGFPFGRYLNSVFTLQLSAGRLFKLFFDDPSPVCLFVFLGPMTPVTSLLFSAACDQTPWPQSSSRNPLHVPWALVRIFVFPGKDANPITMVRQLPHGRGPVLPPIFFDTPPCLQLSSTRHLHIHEKQALPSFWCFFRIE